MSFGMAAVFPISTLARILPAADSAPLPVPPSSIPPLSLSAASCALQNGACNHRLSTSLSTGVHTDSELPHAYAVATSSAWPSSRQVGR